MLIKNSLFINNYPPNNTLLNATLSPLFWKCVQSFLYIQFIMVIYSFTIWAFQLQPFNEPRLEPNQDISSHLARVSKT